MCWPIQKHFDQLSNCGVACTEMILFYSANTLPCVMNNDVVISMVTGCGHILGEKDYRDSKEEIKAGD